MDFPDLSDGTVHGNGDVRSVTHGDDSNLIVEFFVEPELKGYKSEQAGRPVYEDETYIRIRIRGDGKRENVRKAFLKRGPGESWERPLDSERWPRAWDAFQKQTTQRVSGTPLEHFPRFTKSTVATLKAMDLHTVEQLAAVGDHTLESMGMGARDWREQARAFLSDADRLSSLTKLESENTDLRDRVKYLEQQIAAIQAEKRGPGRPRKDEAA